MSPLPLPREGIETLLHSRPAPADELFMSPLPLPREGIETHLRGVGASLSMCLLYHFPERGLKPFLADFLSHFLSIWSPLPLPREGIETGLATNEPATANKGLLYHFPERGLKHGTTIC